MTNQQQAAVETDEPERNQRDESAVDTSHLDDVDDGCGCAEVWEHLSEEREEQSN